MGGSPRAVVYERFEDHSGNRFDAAGADRWFVMTTILPDGTPFEYRIFGVDPECLR